MSDVPGKQKQRIAVWLLVAVSGLFAVDGRAEDAVILSTSTGGTRRITGEITDYTGRELLIRTVGGREQSLPGDRIEEIGYTRTQSQIDGDIAFEGKNFAEADRHYRQASTAEKRTWVRRIVMAQRARCLSALGHDEQAGLTFLLVHRSDPTTPDYSAIPLAWRASQVTLSHQRQAQAWLQDEANPTAQLLGASWLLTGDPSLRAAARQTLTALTSQRDPRVAHFATAQLWRLQTATAQQDAIRSWQAAIKRMPENLRGGPYYLLGQLLARHDQRQDAALAFLRVPIQYPDQHQLAGEALLAAADQLEQLGQTKQAITTLQEVVRDHAGTTAAKAAAAELTRLTRREG